MSSIVLSVILPAVTDSEKLGRFCSSLFSGNTPAELLICGETDSRFFEKLPQEYTEKIVLVNAEDKVQSVSKAIEISSGKFLMFSDESVIFAPDAIEKLIVASRGNSAVCNAGIIQNGECNKTFSESFSLEEAAGKAVHFNYLLSTDIIKNNALSLCGTSTLAIMLFIADYLRYDNCIALHEVLVYSDSKNEYTSDDSISYIEEYAKIFSLTQNDKVSLFFIKAVFSALLTDINTQTFEALKNTVRAFRNSELILAWIRASFGVDVDMLLDEDSYFGDFKVNGMNVYYKEITLPMVPDSVVRNFFSGKYGVDMLKKCIGAWLHYKFYCRKDGKIKILGCKLSRKLLGGDFVG